MGCYEAFLLIVILVLASLTIYFRYTPHNDLCQQRYYCKEFKIMKCKPYKLMLTQSESAINNAKFSYGTNLQRELIFYDKHSSYSIVRRNSNE